MKITWPAEWETHTSTWIAWPHQASDFPGKLDTVLWVYTEIVRILGQDERVDIICPPGQSDEISQMLQESGASEFSSIAGVGFVLHECATDRSWLRDSLPTSVIANGQPAMIAWAFNAWAKYDNYLLDKHLPEFSATIANRELIIPKTKDGKRVVLEGGGIETDGKGTMLVTEEWLLSDVQVRNPGLGKADYEEIFSKYLGIQKTIWLGHGCVGDDTHGHIDDIARFTENGSVILAFEDNEADENYDSSLDNYQRLIEAVDANGKPIKVVKLPYPNPVIFGHERLPASYANFYVGNKTVIVPVFNDPKDVVALTTIAREFPSKQVVGIYCRDLVLGLGTLHCLSQQVY